MYIQGQTEPTLDHVLELLKSYDVPDLHPTDGVIAVRFPAPLLHLAIEKLQSVKDDAELCHGYDLEDCRTHFVPDDVELTDEQIREIMDALRDDDGIEEVANEARYDAMSDAFESLIEEMPDDE